MAARAPGGFWDFWRLLEILGGSQWLLVVLGGSSWLLEFETNIKPFLLQIRLNGSDITRAVHDYENCCFCMRTRTMFIRKIVLRSRGAGGGAKPL